MLDDLDSGVSDEVLAVSVVTQAGRLAARLRAEGVESAQKTSVSDLVTSADLAAEELITSTLARLRPEDGLLGEEGTRQESRSGRTWVIDPVDGTFNFAQGQHTWCSALALTDADQQPILGAVHQPGVGAGGETWLGGPGLPTTLDGTPLPRLKDRRLDEGVLGTYVHPATLGDPDIVQPWRALVGRAATVRISGSASVDLAGLACGRLTGWTQHTVAPWDWLPGRALIEGVGGATTVVEHRGRIWCLAGTVAAVASLQAALAVTEVSPTE